MLPKWHMVFGFLFAYIIYWFTSINLFQASLIFLASVLIDFDHYLYYFFRKRKFSLKSAYRWYLMKKNKFLELSPKERKKHRYFIFIFHGFEPLILFFLLSLWIPLFRYVFLGCFFHMGLDLIEAHRLKIIKRKLSVIYSTYKYKK